jgi:hypothetical protein
MGNIFLRICHVLPFILKVAFYYGFILQQHNYFIQLQPLHSTVINFINNKTTFKQTLKTLIHKLKEDK